MNFLDERGESLIQFVVGTLAGALLLAFIASALAGTFQIGAAQSTRQTTELAVDVFTQRVGSEGDSASSVFIPSHDIFGAANSVVNTPTTGGTIGQPANGAHEVDFMQRGSGILGLVGLFDKWWCYYYDGSTHQLVTYTYTTRTAAGLASGVSAAGATISNVRSFNASYLLASQIPQVEHYANSSGAVPTDVLIQLGFPEVYAGNRGVVVWIDATSLKAITSNPKMVHYMYLQPASAPQAPIVSYTWSPPPAQALVAAPNITFASNGAGGWLAGNPSSTITVDEPYYHRGFTNAGCVSGGVTIATLAGPFNLIRENDNVANDPPTSFPGEWEQYAVTPVAAGTCTVTFASSTAAPYPDDKTASVTITVASPDGALNTLGQVEFNSSTIAMLTPQERLAKTLNDLLGGGTAAAGTTSCSYAQLWLQNGSVDANGADGFNQTDANGCATNGVVKLWATEAGYAGQFDVPSANCQAFANIGAFSWNVASYSTITPVSATSGCAFPVASSDRTVSNGGSENVMVVVDAGCSESGGSVAVGQSCSFTIAARSGVCTGYVVPDDTVYSDTFASWDPSIPTGYTHGGASSQDPTGGGGSYSVNGPAGTLTSATYDSGGNPNSSTSTITFTRTAPGPVTFYVYSDDVSQTGHAIIMGDPVCYYDYDLSGPTAVTVN